jgi:hypothetical protein
LLDARIPLITYPSSQTTANPFGIISVDPALPDPPGDEVPIADLAPPPPAEPFHLYLGPFLFRSEINIPELRLSTGHGTHPVDIALGGVPTSIPGAIADGICQLTATEFLLDIAGTARYYVRDGNLVRLEIAPGAPLADVSTYLLGSVFGVLCHQNGMLPLHASAIESAGLVTAFLGHSGAGKSTVAACLGRRGHRIVSDDICLLQPDDDSASSSLHVVPVAGWLKLWNNSLAHLGEQPVEQNRVFSTDDKFRLYLSDTRAPTASEHLRLTRAVFLSRSPDPDAQPTLQPVPLLDAIAGLMEMTYAGYVPESSGNRGRLFQQCARALQGAQPWRLTVPWSLDRMDSVLDLLETTLLSGRSA